MRLQARGFRPRKKTSKAVSPARQTGGCREAGRPPTCSPQRARFGHAPSAPALPGSPATLAFHTVCGYSRTKCCARARPNSSGLHGEESCVDVGWGGWDWEGGRGLWPAECASADGMCRARTRLGSMGCREGQAGARHGWLQQQQQAAAFPASIHDYVKAGPQAEGAMGHAPSNVLKDKRKRVARACAGRPSRLVPCLLCDVVHAILLGVGRRHARVGVREEGMLHVRLQHGVHPQLHKVVHCRMARRGVTCVGAQRYRRRRGQGWRKGPVRCAEQAKAHRRPAAIPSQAARAICRAGGLREWRTCPRGFPIGC